MAYSSFLNVVSLTSSSHSHFIHRLYVNRSQVILVIVRVSLNNVESSYCRFTDMSVEIVACILFAVLHIKQIFIFDPRIDYLPLWNQTLLREVTTISPVYIAFNTWISVTTKLFGSGTLFIGFNLIALSIMKKYKYAWVLLAFLGPVWTNQTILLQRNSCLENSVDCLYYQSVCLYFL